jgi:hypothetical protein
LQKQDFTYLLQQTESITKEQTSNITSVISKYPYFQPARALYLKGLKNSESFKYNQELKVTAAYTTDRSILFDFITSEVFNQNEISLHIKQNSEHLKNIIVNDLEDISVRKSVTIDDALKQHIKNTEGVLDPNLFEEKSLSEDVKQLISNKEEIFNDPFIEIDTVNIKPTPEETLLLGKPLEFDKTETHSFTEWLTITSFKPIVREDKKVTSKKENNSANIDSKLKIIDKFLSSNQKIKPIKELTSKPLMPNLNSNLSDGLMTETLARIYLEQKNYDKAIQSYKILSLKYPEKSGFFADQIKAVKELQENNL